MLIVVIKNVEQQYMVFNDVNVLHVLCVLHDDLYLGHDPYQMNDTLMTQRMHHLVLLVIYYVVQNDDQKIRVQIKKNLYINFNFILFAIQINSSTFGLVLTFHFLDMNALLQLYHDLSLCYVFFHELHGFHELHEPHDHPDLNHDND